MAWNEGVKSFTAGEDLVGHRRVKQDSTAEQVVYADAGEDYIGITEWDADSGERISVKMKNFPGTVVVTAAGTFSLAATLYGAADGKVDDVATGSAQFIALVAATAANDELEAAPTQSDTYVAFADNALYVNCGRADDYTADGSILKPYATINAAVAAVTATRNQVLVFPGTYTLTASIEMPIIDCSITGLGANDAVRIEAAVGVTPLIDISPASLAGTVMYKLNNLLIANGETSQVGIQIDNASAGKKIILIGSRLEIEDGGNAIDVDHAGASDAVRIYINNGGLEIEGAINFDVGNNGDKLFINNAVLGSLITFKGDNVASLLKLSNCESPHDGTAANSATTTQEIVCHSCRVVTGTTYTALDTNDIGAGADFTETILD